MSKGIWLSPDRFVSFAERPRGFAEHIVTRDRAPDFSSLGHYLPNPDPILKAQGKDVAVYRDLRAHAAVGGSIRRRKASVLALEHGINRGQASARVTANIKAIIEDMDLMQFIQDVLEAPLYGYQPIEVIWGKGSVWAAPKALVAKPPEWFVFDTDNQLRFRSRQAPLEGETLPAHKFLLPRNNATYQNPWGVADLSMVFWPATFMKGGLRFWVQFAEKYGTPWLVGKVPRNTEPRIKEALATDLESMIQDAIAVIPDDSSVDIIEAAAKSNSADAYEKLLLYCRSEISIALLGQNQTTEANSTNASATAGLEVADDLRDSDAALVCSTMNTLIEWILYANGISGPAPKFEMWEQEQIDEVQASRDKTLSEAGVRFSKSYWVNAYGLKDDDISEVVLPTTELTAEPLAFAEPGALKVQRLTAQPLPVGELLAKQLTQKAEPHIQSWLESLSAALDSASSLEEAKALAEAAFDSLDSSELEVELTQALLASHLAGRSAVEDDSGRA